jgi:hypothetical protein
MNGKVLISGGGPAGSPNAELFDPVAGTFVATGGMITNRSGHTATLLADGHVLIAGGSATASAELYDPSTGTFSATGSMLTASPGNLLATLLYDGRVLLVGADNELYDPATGTFTVTGAFAEAYAMPAIVGTATLLPEGTVLISGCECRLAGGPLVERYDPGTGKFSLTAGGNGPPGFQWWDNENTATLLRNGKVLIVSSEDWSEGLLYEPSTQVFFDIGNTTAIHVFSTATLLPDGEVLIAGGQLPGGNGSTSTDLYDPATGTFSATGNMTTGRHEHTATLLADGRVLVAGGISVWGAGTTSSAELYVPRLLTPSLVVTDLQFDSTVVAPGASYSVHISGSALTADTFFDVRFTSPGSSLSAVVLNWQRGIVESHDVPADLAAGTWTINGARAHAIETDHTGSFMPVSATITVAPATAQVVRGLQFDRPSVVAGGSYSVNLSGSNLTPQTFFDVRFTAPGSNTSTIALNWQTGLAASHALPLDTAPGNWTINGVRAHQDETDHIGDFNPVSATITVVQHP